MRAFPACKCPLARQGRGDPLLPAPTIPLHSAEREKRHLHGVRSMPIQRTALPACGAARRPTPLLASGGMHWGVAPDRSPTAVATAAAPVRLRRTAPGAAGCESRPRLVLLTGLPGRAGARMVTHALHAYSQCANFLPASSSASRGAEQCGRPEAGRFCCPKVDEESAPAVST